MNKWIRRSTLAVVLVAVFAATTPAADPPAWSPHRYDDGREADDAAEIAAKRVAWPEPVRQVDFVDDSASVLESQAFGFPPAPTVPHQVLVAPNQLRPGDQDVGHFSGGGHFPGGRQAKPPVHHEHRLHHQVRAVPATIPNAARRETWKTPYSYGHFGASHTRSWNRHYGYRDHMTEWRQK